MTTPQITQPITPTWNRLESFGIFILNKEITPETGGELMRYILEANLNSQRQFENIQIIINSPGGDVNTGFAICDTIIGSNLPVYTIGIGLVASAALIVFMTGKKGYRVVTPNTSILSHQWSWGSFGKEHELLAQVKEFDLSNEKFMRHYKKYTGLSVEKIKKYLLPPSDVWLSATEAVSLKIADKIIEPSFQLSEMMVNSPVVKKPKKTTKSKKGK
jgi:ATP-dependent Clp protease protease subunit